jgi:hypothetical protein
MNVADRFGRRLICCSLALRQALLADDDSPHQRAGRVPHVTQNSQSPSMTSPHSGHGCFLWSVPHHGQNRTLRSVGRPASQNTQLTAGFESAPPASTFAAADRPAAGRPDEALT